MLGSLLSVATHHDISSAILTSLVCLLLRLLHCLREENLFCDLTCAFNGADTLTRYVAAKTSLFRCHVLIDEHLTLSLLPRAMADTGSTMQVLLRRGRRILAGLT